MEEDQPPPGGGGQEVPDFNEAEFEAKRGEIEGRLLTVCGELLLHTQAAGAVVPFELNGHISILGVGKPDAVAQACFLFMESDEYKSHRVHEVEQLALQEASEGGDKPH